MSDRRFALLIGAAIVCGAIAINALGHWLHAPYRTCVETHSVDTCHRIFNP